MTRPKGPKPGTGKPLDEAIAEYLLACEVEAKSPRTVQAYAETLRVWGTKTRSGSHAAHS